MNPRLPHSFKAVFCTASLLAAGMLAGSGAALAVEPLPLACDDGKLTITAINPNPIYVTAFPATVPVVATLSFDGPGINFNSLKPFIVNFNGNNVSSTEDASASTVSFDAYVTGPANYPLIITGKRGQDDYCDATSVEAFMSVAVEWKAPPALANEYINSNETYKAYAARVRGCVIKQIAENHAKDEKYGPKGGDGTEWPGVGYDLDLIETDTANYFGICSGN
jgi:hypothetical protein